MAIRDRGLVKWLPAHFAPELRAAHRELQRDMNRIERPLLDEYQIEEMESKICYGMELNKLVKLTVWRDGYTYEEIGHVHYLEPIHKKVRLKTELGTISRIKFSDIIAVKISDKT
ncbi:YolD-like family protein [Cytobacillus oceanisediminis]|uniref:YolD-like family protein n=1 Tax=Cytobacillus oceanisediminis TaxID=665099 RepID=UPI0037359781